MARISINGRNGEAVATADEMLVWDFHR